MIGAKDLLDLVLDEGSWETWDTPLHQPPAADTYRAEWDRARAETGLDEAVATGAGRIDGHRVAIVVSEFAFLAGSVGMAASQRILAAVHRATRERLPLVASPASGGTRLQEGTQAFVQMVAIAAAIKAHRTAGLPYLVYLRHPTTGGVLASWGSLGHVTAAEPGALIGLLGPRAQRAFGRDQLPPDVQTAENLHIHGLVDAVVPPGELRDVAGRVLNVLCEPAGTATAVTDQPSAGSPTATDVWESVVRSRRADRPGVRTLLRVAATDVTPLSGTAAGERDDTLLIALARFGQAACVLLGQDRRVQAAESTLGPAGLREAMRGIQLAADLGLPLVTIVDTPGAVPTQQSEESGLATGIAHCLADLATVRSPTVCVLLGQGGGGTALALLPADRVLCAQHAWLAPLPPEAASDVLYRTTARAADVVRMQRVDSTALLSDGIADRVIPEHPDAADEPEAFSQRLGRALEAEILALAAQEPNSRLAARAARFQVGH